MNIFRLRFFFKSLQNKDEKTTIVSLFLFQWKIWREPLHPRFVALCVVFSIVRYWKRFSIKKIKHIKECLSRPNNLFYSWTLVSQYFWGYSIFKSGLFFIFFGKITKTLKIVQTNLKKYRFFPEQTIFSNKLLKKKTFFYRTNAII